MYAQLTRVVEPKNVVEAAHKLGITSPLKGYFSIALGGEAVNPLEMARAYAAFANGGKRIDGSIIGNRPRVILSVNGKKNAPKPKQVIGETNAEIVTSILQQVVQQGTGKRAQLPDGRPVAGKTGHDGELRGRVVRRLHAAARHRGLGRLPEHARADALAVPRRRRCGRHVPGGDLARVQQDGAAVPEGRAGELPGAGLPRRRSHGSSSSATARTSSTTGSAGTRSRSRTSREGAEEDRELQAERGRGAERGRDSATTRRTPRLAAQPLTPVVVYKPASGGQQLHVVVKQLPLKGRLSSFDKVTIVFAKPLHGVIPDVVGMTLPAAEEKLGRLKLVRRCAATGAKVVRQRPRGGVRGRARGSPSPSGYGAADERATREQVAPGQIGGAGDPDARGGDDLRLGVHGRGARTAAGRAAGRRGRRVTPSASLRRPGPAARRRALSTRRRSCIRSTPVRGSSARIRTAAALPSSSQTRLRHQWIPYER